MHERDRFCSLLTVKPIFNMDALFSVRNKAAADFEREILRENSRINSGPLQSILYDQDLNKQLNERSSIYPEKYDQEFVELNKIGRGGFGTVWMARHKIDGIIYAVKKIIFKYKRDSDYLKVIREVKSFATLNHLNVVGYNQAWFEYVHSSVPSSTNSESSSSTSPSKETTTSVEHSKITKSYKTSESSTLSINSKSSKSTNSYLMTDKEDSSDLLISFTNDTHKGAYGILPKKSTSQNQTSAYSQTSYSDKLSSIKEISSGSEVNSYNHKTKYKNSYKYSTSCVSNLRLRLYIQMEYCDCVLRHWLDERSKGSPLPFQLTVLEIFRDILNGVAHIHSKTIIHRDLKPQNIFYSAINNAMKIGDFGLATLNDSSVTQTGKSFNQHSSDCGTAPYAAPEQRSKRKYDCKVDMYSLGIILVELLINATTQMEFSAAIISILNGNLPEKFITNWPEYVELVNNLVSKDPDARLSAKEILSKPGLLANIEIDQRTLMEIKSLKEALAEKDKRIKELETLLDQQSLLLEKLKLDGKT